MNERKTPMEYAVEEIDRLLSPLCTSKVLTLANRQAVAEYLIIWAERFAE